jgi:hypothetical protein
MTAFLLAAATPPLVAQGRGGPGGRNAPPIGPVAERTADGAPNLQGVWLSKWIRDMADGRFAEKDVDVPFTEWGRKLWEERTGNLQAQDPTLKCWPTGVPRQAGTPYPMQIVQSKDLVVILYEGAAHTYRIIPTDGRPHGRFDELWMGDSRGRWEGKTLVVDVTNFNDKTWLDSAGHPHSDRLHITERYTRTEPDTLMYEVTIDDPVAYTRPWTTTYRYRTNGSLEIMEYWCTENNLDAPHSVGK